jgi:hypothetical protein
MAEKIVAREGGHAAAILSIMGLELKEGKPAIKNNVVL